MSQLLPSHGQSIGAQRGWSTARWPWVHSGSPAEVYAHATIGQPLGALADRREGIRARGEPLWTRWTCGGQPSTPPRGHLCHLSLNRGSLLLLELFEAGLQGWSGESSGVGRSPVERAPG